MYFKYSINQFSIGFRHDKAIFQEDNLLELQRGDNTIL